MFVYAGNNPVTLIDHTGLRPLTAGESATVRSAITFAGRYDSGVDSGTIGRVRNLFLNGQIIADDIPQVAIHSDFPGFSEKITIGIPVLQRIETLKNLLEKRKRQNGECDKLQDDLDIELITLASALIHEGTHANGFNRFGQTAADEAAAYTSEALTLSNAIRGNRDRGRVQRGLKSSLNNTFSDALGEEGLVLPRSLRPR